MAVETVEMMAATMDAWMDRKTAVEMVGMMAVMTAVRSAREIDV